MTRILSNCFLRYAGIDLNIAITIAQRELLFLTVWRSITPVKHTSVKHTKLVKAPAYTRALPDIGNEECIDSRRQ